MAKVAKRNGRYVLDFYDNQGKRQRQTLKIGTTKKSAREALRDIEDQLDKGVYLPNAKMPLFSKVAKDWLEYKKPNLRISTWSVYEGHTKNHFSDFDSLKVDRITIVEIEKWISDRQQEGMHLLTLRKVLVSLGQIMAYAVRHRYISYNPVRDAEKPKGQGKTKKKKITILNPEQIKTFVGATDNTKYKVLFRLAIMSGARQGELLALTWADVDGINNQISIRRTFNHQRFFDVKTETSRRKIDIGPAMMKELKKWKLACPPNKQGLIFPNGSGNPINYSNLVNRYFFPALEAVELPKIRFHDLRHTYASLMIEQGENIKYIQSQLGHSSPTVTLNVYAHLMKKVNQEAAIRLENTIF